jgi:predicted S18 family serine protease
MMNLKIALASLLLVGLALPAAADSYYLTQDMKTKKCTVTRERPTTTEVTVIGGDGTVYTQTEAEGAMKITKVCTTE